MPEPRQPLSDAAWRAEFTRQCNAQLYAECQRFAARCATTVRRAGGHVDDYYAKELVHDIVSDTATGILSWDPTEMLQNHIQDEILSRVRHARKRARRYPHERVDAFASDDESSPLQGEIEAALAVRAPCEPAPQEVPTCAQLAPLRARANAPADHQVINAMAAGAVTKADILAFTGLTERGYRLARRRLQRHLKNLAAGK